MTHVPWTHSGHSKPEADARACVRDCGSVPPTLSCKPGGPTRGEGINADLYRADTPGSARLRLPGHTQLNIKRVLSCLSDKSNGLGRGQGPESLVKTYRRHFAFIYDVTPTDRQASRQWRGLQDTKSRTSYCCPSPRLPGVGRGDGRGTLPLGPAGSNLWALLCRQAHLGAVCLPSKGVPHIGALAPLPWPLQTRPVCRERGTRRTSSSLPAPSGSGRAFAAAVPTNRLLLPGVAEPQPQLTRKVELPPAPHRLRREMQIASNQLGAETLKQSPRNSCPRGSSLPRRNGVLNRGAAAGLGGSPDLRRHVPPGPGSEGAEDRPPESMAQAELSSSWGGKPTAVLRGSWTQASEGWCVVPGDAVRCGH